MGFQWTAYDNSQSVQSIGHLMLRAAAIRSEQARQIAAIEADRQERAAQARAQMVTGIGGAVSGTIGDILRYKQEAPLRAQQAARAAQDEELRGLHVQQARYEVGEPQRAQAASERQAREDQQLVELFTRGPKAGLGVGVGEQEAVQGLSPTPDRDVSAEAYRIAGKRGLDAFKEWRAAQPKVEPPKLITRNPTDDVIDPSTGKVITPGTPAAVKPEKVTYGAPQTQMVGGKRSLVRPGSDGRLYDMNLKPIDAAMVAPEPQKVDPPDVGVELTAGGLDAAARLYAQTAQLPPMGMGAAAAGTRAKIINRAAELYPEMNLAGNKADYAADSSTLTKLTQQRAAIGAFEQTAQRNIDLFLTQAGKVVDTGSPLANTIARAVSGKMLGSPDQAAFDAARQVAINEIAKITTNPNLSGQLSDTARHEVEAFNPSNATLKQAVAVMRLLKQDMQNRTQSLDEAIAGLKGRLSSRPGAAQSLTDGPKEGATKPIDGYPGTEQTYRGGKWIRTK